MLWYSLEVPRRSASNEYPQHMFSWRNKKNIMWVPPLICSYEDLVNQSQECNTWPYRCFFSADNTLIRFLFYPEDRLCYFMQIVPKGDDLHKMSKPIFCAKSLNSLFKLRFWNWIHWSVTFFSKVFIFADGQCKFLYIKMYCFWFSVY